MGFYCKEKYVSDETFDNKNVIRAIDRFSGETVALKRWAEDDPDAGKEAGVWKTVYPDLFKDTCRDAPYVYLVRRWIEGITLERYRISRAALSGEEISDLFEKILSAVEAFYRGSYIIHGDIKPENIILTEDGGVVLIDFETAMLPAVSEYDEKVGLNSLKTVCFASRAYSAPEVYHGEVTACSDIYSLGMIFLFLAAGVPQRDKIAKLPAGFASFCRKCTDPEPAMRYQSLQEMRAALNALSESSDALPEDKAGKEEEPRIVSVENMNVTAKNIQYAFPREMTQNAASHHGELSVFPFSGKRTDLESAAPENDKIVLFPKNMTGYRRLILYIPGNLSFASELAYMSAQLFGLKTGLFEISDYDSSLLGRFLPVNTECREQGSPHTGQRSDSPDIPSAALAAEAAAEESTEISVQETGILQNRDLGKISEERDLQILLSENIAYWESCGLLVPCAGNPDLFLSLCDVVAEFGLAPDRTSDFAVWCYSHFDITILADRSRLKAMQSISLMRYSDYLIVPVNAETDRIEEEKHFYRHFLKQYAIPRGKLRYIGWEYEEKYSVEHESMVHTLGENIYLGTVGYDKDRSVFKNIKGQAYCTSAKPWLKAQYSHIIHRFLFDGLKSA